MQRTTSIYLDLVRFLAAFVIFGAHANYDRFTGGVPGFACFSNLGNDAVMVFFVLSGFVITYVARKKEKSIDVFLISRFARLYSVVIPALILTVILDFIGSRIAYELYDGSWFEAGNPILRIFANLFFVNELWFNSIRAFSNGPFWSIGYEFWYYILFAFAFYLKRPLKYVLLVVVCFLIGPKILILFPVWYMGVVAYKITSSKSLPENLGWLLLIFSIVGYLLYRTSGGPEYLLDYTYNILGYNLYTKLAWSKYFLSSYIIGLFIFINFIGFDSVSHRFDKIFMLLEKQIRYVASYTFVLYLFHYPLLQFFSTITFDKELSRPNSIVVLVSTLLVIWLAGAITEKKKNSYKKCFSIMWDYIYNHIKVIGMFKK